MPETLMSREELAALKAEVHNLETAGRAEVAERIKTAREWGDISENAEYDAAKQEQALLEGRIVKLHERVRDARVVEAPADNETVQFGSTVHFIDVGSGRKQKFKIVAGHEAQPAEGTLSAASPVAVALTGHRRNEIVELRVPAGVRQLKITKIA